MPDLVTIGETMLRLSAPPGHSLEQAPHLLVHAAGSESNVAITLARLGGSAGWISRLVDNPLGRRVFNDVRAQGVDVSKVLWTRDGRVGTYFLEIGQPPRPYRILYDRASSAMSLIDPDEVDWSYIRGAHLLHLTGITPALGPACRRLIERAVKEARAAGVLVSFDVNYRALLWSAADASAALTPLLEGVDVLISTAQDAAIVFHEEGPPETVAGQLQRRFSTRMAAVTAGARAAAASDGRVHSIESPALEPLDRIGAGDAFAGGFLFGVLAGNVERGLQYGILLGSLKHTYYGDVAWVTAEEVEALLTRRGMWR